MQTTTFKVLSRVDCDITGIICFSCPRLRTLRFSMMLPVADEFVLYFASNKNLSSPILPTKRLRQSYILFNEGVFAIAVAPQNCELLPSNCSDPCDFTCRFTLWRLQRCERDLCYVRISLAPLLASSIRFSKYSLTYLSSAVKNRRLAGVSLGRVSRKTYIVGIQYKFYSQLSRDIDGLAFTRCSDAFTIQNKRTAESNTSTTSLNLVLHSFIVSCMQVRPLYHRKFCQISTTNRGLSHRIYGE